MLFCWGFDIEVDKGGCVGHLLSSALADDIELFMEVGHEGCSCPSAQLHDGGGIIPLDEERHGSASS